MATNKSTADRTVERKENKNMKKTQIINLLALALFAYLAIINLAKLGALISAYGFFGGILLEVVFIALALFALYALNQDIMIINCAVDVVKSAGSRTFGNPESRKDSFVRDAAHKNTLKIPCDGVSCECGELIPIGKKFCATCGKPVRVLEVEIPEELVCECGEVISVGKKFCPECGKPVTPKEIVCECGEVVPAGKKFCPECGKKVK